MMGRELPETCRAVVATNKQLENYSASVGFIHNQSVTMHGHTMLKYPKHIRCDNELTYRMENHKYERVPAALGISSESE